MVFTHSNSPSGDRIVSTAKVHFFLFVTYNNKHYLVVYVDTRYSFCPDCKSLTPCNLLFCSFAV